MGSNGLNHAELWPKQVLGETTILVRQLFRNDRNRLRGTHMKTLEVQKMAQEMLKYGFGTIILYVLDHEQFILYNENV